MVDLRNAKEGSLWLTRDGELCKLAKVYKGRDPWDDEACLLTFIDCNNFDTYGTTYKGSFISGETNGWDIVQEFKFEESPW